MTLKRVSRVTGLMGWVLLLSLPTLCAQGFLPPVATSSNTATDSAALTPLLVGQEVPRSLTVIDDEGKKRTILSYKSYLEVFVVVFFSARCEPAESQWPRIKRLNDRYKDWRVAFLAVNTSAPEMRPELEATLKHQKLPWPDAQDDQRRAATVFNISGTPEVVVIDEGGVLRYRGSIDSAPAALDAVVGHVDSVPKPEPPFTGACAL